MTPAKEKAQDIWLSYYELLPDGVYSNEGAESEAKRFALIAVNEIIGAFKDTYVTIKDYKQYLYWIEVKEEIERL